MAKNNSLLASSIFVLAIVAANLSAAFLGPIATPFNAFFLIGLDLSLRDSLHDRWTGDKLAFRMGLLIFSGGAISFLLNPSSGPIAVASCVAFIGAGTADAVTYTVWRRFPYLIRANVSNVSGAMVDSLLFPTIAFGAMMPEIVALQFAAKVAGGFWWSLILRKRMQA